MKRPFSWCAEDDNRSRNYNCTDEDNNDTDNGTCNNECNLDKKTTVHQCISEAARQNHAISSSLINNVSRHKMQNTISFSNLSAMHNAVKKASALLPQHDYIAASRGDLVFSSRIEPFKRVGVSESVAVKRRRTEQNYNAFERVYEMRKEFAKSTTMTSIELENAQELLCAALRDLRGSNGEQMVQTFSMLSRKLKSADSEHCLVIAIRINSGLPVSITMLKRIMGNCWKDGIVTIEKETEQVSLKDLPLSEEGEVADSLGNSPLLLVTHVSKEAM